MNKVIKPEQIQAILQTVYQTNISASLFDALKKLLIELPNEKNEVKTDDTKTDDTKTEEVAG
jgi:hypothetical protein